MKRSFLSLFNLLALLLITACNQDDDLPEPAPCDSVCDYLYLGHIYERSNTIDPRVEGTDLTPYSQIWLGGDVCSETTQEEATLEYLDSLFDLSSDLTHWSVGNHDIRNGNVEWITSRTGRGTYYTDYFDGITLLVLNTVYYDFDDCPKMQEQTELIKSVCDTISESSHLVILMHNIVWGYVEGVAEPTTFANANASWIPFVCDPPTRFETTVYPELIKARQRGVAVVCIAGDMGQTASTYEFTTSDNIVFLASGMTAETTYNEQWPTAGQRDSVMVLTHDRLARELTWKFIDVEDI